MAVLRSKVRTAVIPAAGLGTRFLPATKAIPKEMLPIIDVPMIQHIVEEAVRSGIKRVVLVTARHKEAIENHFDYNYELEHSLLEKQKSDLAELSRSVASMCEVISVRQKNAPNHDWGQEKDTVSMSIGGARISVWLACCSGDKPVEQRLETSYFRLVP